MIRDLIPYHKLTFFAPWGGGCVSVMQSPFLRIKKNFTKLKINFNLAVIAFMPPPERGLFCF